MSSADALPTNPRISIILPTIGRPDDLRRMIPTLVAQTIRPHELVLVNAGDMDLRDLCLECLGDSGIALKYATSRPGTSLQRNIALDMADGDVYFLFDDDVLLEPTYIERSLECFALPYEPPVGVVLGTFNQPPREGGWRRRYFQLFGMTHSVEGGDARLQTSGAVRWLIDPPEIVRVPVASGGRTAYRRACLDEERFDEFLPGYTMSEDVELSYRVSQRWTIVHTPYARMIHNHSATGRVDYGDRVARLIYSRYYFFKKHLPKDPQHIAAFAWSNVGTVLLYGANATLHRQPAVLRGIARGYKNCLKDATGRRDW